MTISTSRLFTLLAAVTTSLLVAGCDRSNSAARCEIVLVTPRSGPQAAIGEQVGRARSLIEDVLAAQKVHDLAIREVDSAGSPAVARAEVDRVLSRGRAPIVVGSIMSAETREFMESALRRGVVIIANGSSDPQIRTFPWRRPGDGFFRNWPADDLEGQIMAQYLVQSNRARRLVIFHANDPYANALSSAFAAEFKKNGGTIIGTTAYDATGTTFDDLLRRYSSDRPDGFYIVGFPADIAGFYNTIRRTPATATLPVYSAVGVESGDFDEIAKPPLEGLFYTAPAVDDSARRAFDFRQTYSARFGGDRPDIVAAITYDALYIAIDAVRQVGCDAAAIKRHLYSAPSYDGVSGPTAFDELGDVVTKPVAIKYFERGERRLAKTATRTQ